MTPYSTSATRLEMIAKPALRISIAIKPIIPLQGRLVIQAAHARPGKDHFNKHSPRQDIRHVQSQHRYQRIRAFLNPCR
jgi:hypothetical protein